MTCSESIECSSHLVNVVVYSRGAVVTRRLELPKKLPTESVELVVSGLTPLTETGTIRCVLSGERELVSVRSQLVIPDSADEPSALKEELQTLTSRLGVEKSRLSQLSEQKQALNSADVSVRLKQKQKWLEPGEQLGHARGVIDLLDDRVTHIDAEHEKIRRIVRDLEREIESVRVKLGQATSLERVGADHPNCEVFVTLAEGGAKVEQVELTYQVSQARWWPAYSARIEPDGLAKLTLEAFVAQCTMEDWNGVKISVCTADLYQDIRLPELPSLRLGRAQTVQKRGFRPAPKGLETLFSGFDEAMKRAASDRPEAMPSEPPPAPQSKPPPKKRPLPKKMMAGKARDERETSTGAHQAVMPEPPVAASMPGPSPPPAMAPRAGAAPPAPKAAPQSMRANKAKGGRRDVQTADYMLVPDEMGAQQIRVAGPSGIKPAPIWLDFDNLVLKDEGGHRGKLRRRPAPVLSPMMEQTAATIEGLSAPPGVVDPRSSRGRFDQRFDGDSTVDVPSNALIHRLELRTLDGDTFSRFRTVPREEAAVFHEVVLINPLEARLLEGPMDVFFKGGLVNTSQMKNIDRGGLIVVGLGAEDRLRVARNVNVLEESRGLLGGRTEIEHKISIEIASLLNHRTTVEVIERLPVTYHEDVEIKLLKSEPRSIPYDQAELASPVKGGLRWDLQVPEGEKVTVTFSYVIQFPSKSEIVGGNRRE